MPLLKLNSRISKVRQEGTRKVCDVEIDVTPSLATAMVQIIMQAVPPFVVSPMVVHLKDLSKFVVSLFTICNFRCIRHSPFNRLRRPIM